MVGDMKEISEIIREFCDDGFEELTGHGSRIGSTMLIHRQRNEVAKIGADPAYGKFVSWARNSNDVHLPVFHDHYEYESQLPLVYYSVTLMERLEELTGEEEKKYTSWYDEVQSVLQTERSWGSIVSDPLGLLETIKTLWGIAGANGVCADLKSSNIMVRAKSATRELVITDPFN